MHGGCRDALELNRSQIRNVQGDGATRTSGSVCGVGLCLGKCLYVMEDAGEAKDVSAFGNAGAGKGIQTNRTAFILLLFDSGKIFDDAYRFPGYGLIGTQKGVGLGLFCWFSREDKSVIG
jgi:hypothetical protein